MELRVLRYFLTVAREENISKAASALMLTQPTLSRQLADLESELGAPLFLRGKRKIVLTEEGILLRRRAEEIVELADKTEREFRGRGETLGGTVSIGAAECKAAKLLPEAIDSFRKKYPLVTFELYSDIADHVKDRLDRGLIDLALLIEPDGIEKYEYLRLDASDRCGILMSALAPLATKETVTVEDLTGLPILANKRQSIRNLYRNALGEAYDKLNVFATYNLVNNAALFAIENRGYVFTIEGAVSNFQNEALCFKPFFPEIKQTAFLIYKKYQPLNRTVAAFLDEVKMLLKHNKG